jgi:DNA-binding GntR family transcriptional regulator
MAKSTAPTHSETIRLAIEKDIFTGKLRAGTPLDEEAIARRFAVSRTPVREAMMQLVQSGLIEKQPRQGAVVAKMDLRDMIQMFEVMSELEGICGKIAARRMSKEERGALRELHGQAENALLAQDFEAYYALSRRFHLAIINGTHNTRLIETTNKLGLQLVPYRRFQLNYPGRKDANLSDHAAILEAVVDGNSDEAYRQFIKHTQVQGDVLTDFISQPALSETSASPFAASRRTGRRQRSVA